MKPKSKSFLFSNIIIFCLLIGVVLVSLISLNRLNPFTDSLNFHTSTLGIIGWITVCLTVLYLIRDYGKQALLVFIVFLVLGYSTGPFLEPPVDPLEHLRRTETHCELTSTKVKINMGFWHYSMSGVLLCNDGGFDHSYQRLAKIDLLHGIYWGVMMVCLFCAGKAADLPNRWAFFGCLVAFLFFGTNRFSYFSYYSLASSFSSMFVYWAWIAIFFFRNHLLLLLIGLLSALALLPVLWINHQQEAAFLLVTVAIWIGWNFHQRSWAIVRSISCDRLRWLTKAIYLILPLLILYVIPQLESFQSRVFHFFPRKNFWSANQSNIFFWNEWHIFGTVWDSRVNDTLGLMGFLPLLLIPFLLFGNTDPERKRKLHGSLILGVLPFLVYLTPLFLFFWTVSVRPNVYYRMAYASLFWIPLSHFLYCLDYRSLRLFQSPYKYLWRIFYPFAVISIICLAGIRSTPIYGKLDFILLEGKPWGNQWDALFDDISEEPSLQLITDPVTETVLNAVYLKSSEDVRTLRRERQIDIEKIEKRLGKTSDEKYGKQRRCLVNLIGFEPSWVAVETGHWQPDLAYTSRYYTYRGVKGDALNSVLKDAPLKHCKVFYRD